MSHFLLLSYIRVYEKLLRFYLIYYSQTQRVILSDFNHGTYQHDMMSKKIFNIKQ